MDLDVARPKKDVDFFGKCDIIINVIKRKTLEKKLKRTKTLKNEKGIKTMTQREFFTRAIEANIDEEMNAKAKELLAGLDKRNSKKASTQTKTQKENEVLKAEMLNKLVKDKGYLAAEIGVIMGFSTSKASALAKQLVVEGKATVADVKVKNKGTQKSYTILAEPIEVDTEVED